MKKKGLWTKRKRGKTTGVTWEKNLYCDLMQGRLRRTRGGKLCLFNCGEL